MGAVSSGGQVRCVTGGCNGVLCGREGEWDVAQALARPFWPLCSMLASCKPSEPGPHNVTPLPAAKQHSIVDARCAGAGPRAGVAGHQPRARGSGGTRAAGRGAGPGGWGQPDCGGQPGGGEHPAALPPWRQGAGGGLGGDSLSWVHQLWEPACAEPHHNSPSWACCLPYGLILALFCHPLSRWQCCPTSTSCRHHRGGAPARGAPASCLWATSTTAPTGAAG